MDQHRTPDQAPPRAAPQERHFAARGTARRITLFFLLMLLLFLLVSGLTFWAAAKRTQSIASTRRTYEVLLAFQRAELAWIDRVAALRLYLEAPSESVLEAYSAAQRGLDADLAAAQKSAMENPGQQERLGRIQVLARRWQDSADLIIQGMGRDKVAGLDAARRTLGQRAALVESARQEFDAGKVEVLQLLHRREEAERRILQWFTGAGSAALLIGFVMAGAVLAMVRHLEAGARALGVEIQQRNKADVRANDLVELAPHPMVITDQEGRIVQVNAQAMRAFGYAREEMIGQPVELLLPLRYRDIHPGLRNSYMIAPTIRPMGTGRDLFALRKDGSEFPVDISLGPIQAEGGLQVMASIVDITDRARAQEALRRANHAFEAVNRELDSFSYSVAHDLRAPLRSITGFAQLLLSKHRDKLGSEAQDYLERIRQSGYHMAQLIDDLLTLSRITRGDLRREPVSVTGMVHEVLNDLRTADPDRDVLCVVEEGLHAAADVRLLRVLLDNLLGNAWKFTSRVPQARIEFGTLPSAAGYTYFVRDNGAGFNMAYADKLFRAFERLHDTREFSGTGIGLATAHRIIARHGGRIWAEGAEGQGATFYFTL